MFKFWLICILVIVSDSCSSNLCSCSSGLCQFCLASFAYLNNNTCFICPIECATCSSPSTCLTCRPNYYLANSTCNLCPLNCQICTPNCTQCIDGYALVQNQCLPCNDANALTCQTPTTVSACMSGYWENGNSCSPCREFCLLCSSSSNCFQCQDGYQVSVSFGSYCSSCPSGCKSCSSNVCTQCLYNYQLVNGNCYDISQNCSTIMYCSKCSYINSSVFCHSCNYPFYLNNSACIEGSSLLCQNGSIGPMFYQCINQCYVFGYQIDKFNGGIVCQPNSWINSNEQLYFNAYSSLFSNFQLVTSLETIAFNPSIPDSILSFTIWLSPYYKLQLYFKLVALNLNQQNITLTYELNDNSSNSEVHTFNESILADYEPAYMNFTTKTIKDQLVTIKLRAESLVSTNLTIGLSELLIEVYSCPANCRICYNGQLCKQCYGGYFNTPDNICVTSCTGYLQLFIPDGNPNNYTSKSCVLQCPSSFYTFQNITDYTCNKCSGNCVTCLSDFECLSCKSPLFYYEINYTCLAACPNTHFSQGSTCVPCNAPCETCTDAVTCLTCSVGYLNNNKCYSTCLFGTYQNNLNNTCSACNFKCSSCLGSATYCLSCNSNYLLSESTCVLNCTFGLYYQSNGTCEPCVIPCLQCTTMTDCLSCSVGYLDGTRCLSQCPNQYYADSFNAICQPCSNGCLTCLSSTICLSCPNTTNLFSYSCYSTCPLNTYSSMSICVNCLLPCESCSNQSFCTSCSIGYLSQVTLGLCISQCEDGYFGFDLNRSCLSCTNNCSTCSVTSYLCTSCLGDFLLQNSACVQNCAAGFFNLSGTCYSCTYPCLTCIGNDYFCTSCYNSYILINNTCQTQCPSNTYFSSGSCSACQFPCESCFSKVGCLTCTANSSSQTFLYGSTCIAICPSSTFADPSSLLCRSCIYPCENCTSQEKCLSCATGYLDVTSGTCSICPDTMFANDTSRQCQKCSQSISNCLICISSTQCTKCSTNYYLYNASCIAPLACINLTYFYVDTLLQACSKCISPCNTCLNQSYCSSCTSGYLLGGSCLIYCPSNYYQIENICYQCSPPCLTCSSNTVCLSCNSSSLQSVILIVNATCIKFSDCPSGYYIQTILNAMQCIKCALPCLTCSSSSYCLSCFSGILINGSCKSLCPSMYFANTTNSSLTLCSQCSSNCFKCTKSADYCTSCNANLYLRNHICVSSCGSGYYLDQTILECFSCLQPCGNCSSISMCLDCQNSSYILYYGECLSSCPDGSYSNQSSCITCPSSCLTCQHSQTTNQILCISCNYGLFMSSTSEGSCVNNCSSIQYGDILTRSCFSCIAPCVSCLDAVHCLSCQTEYLLYKQQCLKISRCPIGSYLLKQSCISDCGILWADYQSATCIQDCTPLSLKIAQGSSKLCLNECPNNYRVDSNYTCISCNDGLCNDLMNFQIDYKNIFNILFLKLTFNQAISANLLQKQMLSIILESNSHVRLLYPLDISYSISSSNLDAIWIQLSINQSLKSSTITLLFSDIYIFEKPLQSLHYSLIINNFDYYLPEEQANAGAFQRFAEVMSVVMVLFFVLNLFLNSGHLSYSIIDYYQLLFMVLFLSIDFSPQLNSFLYGFRYSHFFFLPQIFRVNSQNSYTTATPNEFGVIVPDVNFINNTGQDFIIIFVTIGVLVICKLMELCFERFNCFRSNKVGGEGIRDEQSQPDERCLVKLVKAIISRFKWNYFNDIIYSIYFSIMLFAFSQLYDLQWRQSALSLVSILLAFLFLLLGLFLPFFLGWFLHRNQKNLIQHSLQKQKHDYLTNKKLQQSIKPNDQEAMIETSQKAASVHKEKLPPSKSEISSNKSHNQELDNKFQILTDYKCFLSGIKLKVRLGFYQIPIRYGKKLVLAALLVYCSEYPSLVLGVIMMFCFINILITIILKPYRLTFEQIVYPIFDALYMIIFFIICVLQLPILNLTKSQKLTASYICISLCTLLSLLLAIHNIILNVVEIIKYFCKVDYFSKYYQTEYVSSSEDSDHLTEQGTNTPLKREPAEQEQQFTGSDIFSGLDIYLKKESTAPKYLIKCVKEQYKNQDEKVVSEEGKESSQHHEDIDHSLRGSHQKIVSQALSSNHQITASSKLVAERLVKGIQPINFEEESEESS